MAMRLSEFAKMKIPRPDDDLVNNASARIQYLYRCSECPEETRHSSPDLQDCPYCRHALSEPRKIDMDEFPPVTGVPRGRGGCGDIS